MIRDTLLQSSGSPTTQTALFFLSNRLLIVPLKYLVHHYSSLIISAVAIVSSYAFRMKVCLFVDWRDRACMWEVLHLCKSACHNWGVPAGVFMDRQPFFFFRPSVSISLWDVTPFFCRSLCEICSPLICCVNPPWIAAVVSSSLIDSDPLLLPSSFALSLFLPLRLQPQLRLPSSILLSVCPSRGERTEIGKGLLDSLRTEEET